MAAYRLVYDLRHLQADCQEPGSASEPYARCPIEYGLPFYYCQLQRERYKQLTDVNITKVKCCFNNEAFLFLILRLTCYYYSPSYLTMAP